MQNIINFYKSFDRYSCFTNETIFEESKNCIKNNQYKVFVDDKGMYGFVNWTFLNQENLDYFLKTGMIQNYNCGNIFVHLDFLAKRKIKQIYKWSLKNICKYVKVHNQTQWLRLDKNNGVRNIIKKTVRESWNG